MAYIKSVAVAIDQLGNAICGGNPDATISGRAGYFAARSTGSQGVFWRSLEAAIDWAFLPIDGDGHCVAAAVNERQQLHQAGSDLARAALAVITLPVCAAIGVLLRIGTITLSARV